eukprot:9485445-Pyramimonas_sp.AAC.1
MGTSGKAAPRSRQVHPTSTGSAEHPLAGCQGARTPEGPRVSEDFDIASSGAAPEGLFVEPL